MIVSPGRAASLPAPGGMLRYERMKEGVMLSLKKPPSHLIGSRPAQTCIHSFPGQVWQPCFTCCSWPVLPHCIPLWSSPKHCREAKTFGTCRNCASQAHPTVRPAPVKAFRTQVLGHDVRVTAPGPTHDHCVGPQPRPYSPEAGDQECPHRGGQFWDHKEDAGLLRAQISGVYNDVFWSRPMRAARLSGRSACS